MTARRSTPLLITVLAVLAAAVAAGCHASVYDAVDPEVTLETPVAWAGGDVVLVSAAFLDADTLPLVLLGTDTAAARFAAPDSLHFVAPLRPGRYDLQVGFHGKSLLPAGTLTVGGGFHSYGFVDQVGGYPLLWPGGGSPQFLMALPTGLALVDPRAAAMASILPDSMFSQWCIDGPGPAPDGRVVVQGRVAFGSCGPLVAVRPRAVALTPDTGPMPGTGFRFAAELGPGRWLVFAHHRFESWSRDPSGTWTETMYWYGEPYDVAVSPRGDRAVPIGGDSHGAGTPVFTPASVEPAYVLTGFVEVWGAQFSDDGDTLYVAAQPADTTGVGWTVLAALRASDGSVIRSIRSWTGGYAVVLDPGRRWIYLVGTDAAWTPTVQVIDRGTLTLVATLSVPSGGYPLPGGVPSLYTAISPLERRLYLVDTCAWCTAGYRTPVLIFDLLP